MLQILAVKGLNFEHVHGRKKGQLFPKFCLFYPKITATVPLADPNPLAPCAPSQSFNRF
jgi:hypothetical protein